MMKAFTWSLPRRELIFQWSLIMIRLIHIQPQVPCLDLSSRSNSLLKYKCFRIVCGFQVTFLSDGMDSDFPIYTKSLL